MNGKRYEFPDTGPAIEAGLVDKPKRQSIVKRVVALVIVYGAMLVGLYAMSLVWLWTALWVMQACAVMP